MELELQQRLAALEQKIDSTFQSAEKTRKYMLWTLIGSIIVFVVPLIGLLFVIPQFLKSFDVYKLL